MKVATRAAGRQSRRSTSGPKFQAEIRTVIADVTAASDLQRSYDLTFNRLVGILLLSCWWAGSTT